MLSQFVTGHHFGIFCFTNVFHICYKSIGRIGCVGNGLTTTVGQIDIVGTTDCFAIAHLLAIVMSFSLIFVRGKRCFILNTQFMKLDSPDEMHKIKF